LLPDDIAFRANFSTIKDGKIVDRRAGRNEYKLEELSRLLNFEIEKDYKAIFKKSSGHRGVLILRGKNLSPNVSDTDPEETGVPIKKSVPLDNSEEAKFTAEILNKFSEMAYEILSKSEIQKERISKNILPANIVLLRGAGKLGKIESFKDKYNLKGACIAGVNLIKGIGKAINLEVVNVEGANGHVNSNIKGKFEKCVELLKMDYDFVFLHIKGVDEISHDGDFEGKVKMIEKIDK
ncbi:MAG: phosphoglycerate mutase, partial [Candidatus Altarchaeaceae archaeon]